MGCLRLWGRRVQPAFQYRNYLGIELLRAMANLPLLQRSDHRAIAPTPRCYLAAAPA
jgi:hypothetical protein